MSSPPVPLTPFGSALAGALGAVFSNALVYPLDTVKTRLQALPTGHLDPKAIPKEPKLPRTGGLTSLPQHLLVRIKRWEMLRMLVRILRTEGVGGAFKGFSANMINTFSQQFAYFFFHTLLRTAAIRRLSTASSTGSSKSLSTSMELLLGALAGGLGQIFTIPVSVIATRQQLWMPSGGADAKGGEKEVEPSFMQTAEEIIAEGGPTALWTGLKPGLVLTVNPAITYGVFERLKTYVLSGSREGGKLGVGEAFWIGVGSKTLATVVTYPYIFAKVRLQAKQMEEHQSDPPVSSKGGSNEKGDTSYAAIASHPPSSDAPIVSGDHLPPPSSTSAPTSAPGASAPASLGKPTPKRPGLKRSKTGAIQLLRKVYEKQGFLGWYQGLGAQIVKAVLCQGILFVSKEHFEVYAALILAFLGRMRSRLPIAVA